MNEISKTLLQIPFPPVPPQNDSGYFEIVSMARYLPPRKVSTQELIIENGLALKDTIITRSTGVTARHIAEPSHSDSDVLAAAASKCLYNASISVDALSRIFTNKLLGDRILPPTSALMQRKLNATQAIQCMDIDGGANGFLQALLMAGRCIDGGDTLVLVASGGVHQKLMNTQNSRTAFLFGDASTAILLRASDKRHLLAHYEFSNHALQPFHHAIDFYHFVFKYLHGGELELFEMGNLNDTASYYQNAAAHTMAMLLKTANCSIADIDMFFISQMSLPLWQSIVDHLELPPNKVISVLPQTGNTLSANIPLQLIEWKKRQSTDLSQKKIMILSLGEGFLGGGCIYEF